MTLDIALRILTPEQQGWIVAALVSVIIMVWGGILWTLFTRRQK